LVRLWHEVKGAQDPSKETVNMCCARLDEWNRLLPSFAGAGGLLSHADTANMQAGMAPLWTHFANLDKVEACKDTLTSAEAALKEWNDPAEWKTRLKELPLWTGETPEAVLAALRAFVGACVANTFGDATPSDGRPSE
jgi:hypothetical protein